MFADLVLTVLQEASEELGYVAGFAVTDQMIVALGGVSNRESTVLASSNARDFEIRATPRQLGLRDALAVGDGVWACGEYGQLAVTRDHGESWRLFDTGSDGCLFALALGADGAIWIVGEGGYAARVLGDRVVRVELGTRVRLSSVYAVREEVVVLGYDGMLRRRAPDGTIAVVPCGATRPLNALAISARGTWVVCGDGGFLARSPDGQWFSRVASDVDVDLEAVAALPDGSLVAAGDRGQILRSLDDGRSWRPIPNRLGLAHLWSIERFGGGVLIGGDDGLVVKLAPPGDATWSERVNVFGGGRPLDALFAPGPDGFIAHGLVPYLDAVCGAGEGELGDGDGDGDDDGDDDDNDDDDDADDDLDDDPGDGDPEAFELLGAPGDADSFRDVYGAPLPAEAEALLAAAGARARWRGFAELLLDGALLPDVGDHNLFELLVRRNQRASLGTELVEAFCGVFAIGSQGNGDTYHLELYEWDGPRQVLHFDHEAASFTGVVADALDSLAYLEALVRAGDTRAISDGAFAAGLRALRGRVAPTWHFAIEEKDDGFVALEPRRRDTEFFFYRARWICALLVHDGAGDLAGLRDLFMEDFNQVIPAEQLPARYEACERFIPTALYAMWRAFLFDEPELERYLELGRGHAARLVRDAARLIDELRAGRNELGTITDVRAHLAAFRALDLDPRRAPERRAEAAARGREAALRFAGARRELAGAPAGSRAELAWRWLDDGAAHRALFEQLAAARPDLVAELRELRELRDDDLALALPRLARAVTGELEALLVGLLVRAADPPPDDPSDDPDDDDDDPGDELALARLAPFAGPLLAERARAGLLDARAAPALRARLERPARCEPRHADAIEVLGALRDRDGVPALIAFLAANPVKGPLDAADKGDVLAAAARALGAIADPRAAPALARLAAAPGRHGDAARAAAADALASCLAAAPGPRAVDDAVLAALIDALHRRDDGELDAELYFAFGRLARELAPPQRELARRRLEATPPARGGHTALLARRLGLALAGADAGVPPEAALPPLVRAALTELDDDHERTVHNLRLALRVAEALPALVDPADLVWLTRFTEPDIRAAAHALLAQLRHALPPAPVVDPRAARELDDDALVRLLREPHVVGRGALVAEAARRDLTRARGAVRALCDDVIARAHPGGGNLLDPDTRVLEAAVPWLRTRELDAATLALFERMLRHPNHHVKWELLQDPPDDERLLGGMLHVAAERWGWQEQTAKLWLSQFEGTPAFEEARRRAAARTAAGDARDDEHVN